MPPDIRTQLAAIFKANPALLAVEFAYAGRRDDGQLTEIRARSRDGLPLDLDALRSPTKMRPKETLHDPLFHLIHALAPGWPKGLGSHGTGVVNRTLHVRMLHTERRVEAVTNEIEA